MLYFPFQKKKIEKIIEIPKYMQLIFAMLHYIFSTLFKSLSHQIAKLGRVID